MIVWESLVKSGQYEATEPMPWSNISVKVADDASLSAFRWTLDDFR